MNRKQLIQGFPLLSCAFNGFLLAFKIVSAVCGGTPWEFTVAITVPK